MKRKSGRLYINAAALEVTLMALSDEYLKLEVGE